LVFGSDFEIFWQRGLKTDSLDVGIAVALPSLFGEINFVFTAR